MLRDELGLKDNDTKLMLYIAQLFDVKKVLLSQKSNKSNVCKMKNERVDIVMLGFIKLHSDNYIQFKLLSLYQV